MQNSSAFSPMSPILSLLHQHKDAVAEQITRLRGNYAHVLRKIHYYEDIQESLTKAQPLPKWQDYKQRTYESELP